MNKFWRWRPSPAVRIALGLVSLTVTLVLVGEMFTGYPTDRGDLVRRYNAQLARSLGQQLATGLNAGPEGAATVQRVLADTQQREPRLLSARVLDAQGRALGQVGAHAAQWRLEPGAPSTVDNIRVPLMLNDQPWGEVQLAFVPIAPHTLAGWLQQPFLRWLAFLAGMGLLVYLLYLRRVLRHLDPNAAVPERVRAAFDTLTEGVLVLDPAGRVMLANQAFSLLHNEAPQALVGRDAASLPWLLAALPEDQRQPPPWRRAAQLKQPVLQVPLRLAGDPRIAGQRERQLVMNCAPISDEGRVRGCLASFSDVTELQERTERLHAALQEISASQSEIERKNEELTLLATRDALTGIFNRRSLMQQAELRFAEARAAGTPISCIMCDIDHFKSVNDRYGHAGGDRVIQGAAKALLRGLRLNDFVGRYGGEEFCVVLPGGTLEQAREVAERLREDVEANLGSALREHADVRVTMSFGVAEIAPDLADPSALIDLADQALYHAKKTGRNRVIAWTSRNAETAGAA
ncbi:diguanylate cyclase [Pseudorhodoferax sp. Leaf267]|uniref:GGDEF domain-containing protein n=1 Tax=Pseudorhodoferax sp. Leaf267 TaxID=1736316 RepID=UPI0006F55383|nr:GGDEF domain-containing protein [Pseudorhodoferax sp. Leaf267]KQP17598.1 hypothetical protein ASF43_06795 [Pseudorhodoferax sp. Leaf267]